MFKYVIAAAALIIPTAAQAGPDWRQVAEDSSGAVYYLDANEMSATFSSPRTSRRFWVHVDTSADASAGYYSAKQYIGINCDTRRYRFHAIVLFDEYGSVFASDYNTTNYQIVVPGSVIEEIASYVCAS
jgi:hypothetical protein